MPTITISRMYGSGGSELAARVAARLGWLLLDNALVEEVAARLGTTPAEVEAREERVSSLAERLARALMFGSPETTTALPEALMQPTEEQILHVTQLVIDETVARGPVVLVGRGAQCALAQRTDALHVFCYAPLPALVERARQRLVAGHAQALARRGADQPRPRPLRPQALAPRVAGPHQLPPVREHRLAGRGGRGRRRPVRGRDAVRVARGNERGGRRRKIGDRRSAEAPQKND